MPHSSKNLKPYKTEIISLFQNDNNFYDSIAHVLQNKYNLQITGCTIASRLKEWRICKWNCMTTSDTVLHAWIKILFFEIGLEENDMLHALQDEGFAITSWTLRDVQHRLGLWCRMNPIEAQKQTDEIVEAIEEELEKGTIEGYEKELLHHHFWNRGFMIAQWVIWLSEAFKLTVEGIASFLSIVRLLQMLCINVPVICSVVGECIQCWVQTFCGQLMAISNWHCTV